MLEPWHAQQMGYWVYSPVAQLAQDVTDLRGYLGLLAARGQEA